MSECTMNRMLVLEYYAVYLAPNHALPSAIFICRHCADSFVSKHAPAFPHIKTLDTKPLADAIKHCANIVEINNANDSATGSTLNEIKLDQ